MAVLLSVFLFLGQKGFSESTPRTILLGESQHFDLETPVTIPFACTQEIINEMRQKNCHKLIGHFLNVNKQVQGNPTLDGQLLDSQFVIDPGTPIGELDLVIRSPLTMAAVDPQMDEFGIFFHFDTATGNANFDASFEINCNLSDTTNSPSTTSSGQMISDLVILGFALSIENTAKHNIDLEDISGPFFSVSRALDNLTGSLSDTQELRDRFEDNNIMVGMSTIQAKLTCITSNDNEAIMLLEPLSDITPSLTDGEFTTALTSARRFISEAIKCKKMIQAKLQRIERNQSGDK